MSVGGIHVRGLCGRRSMAIGGVATVIVLAVAAIPQLLGSQVQHAFGRLDDVQPGYLWGAGLAFVVAMSTNAWGWRAALQACGGRMSRAEAVGAYGIGSLVNTVVPARVGDAVRIGLFSRALESRERLWTTGGVFSAIGAARALCLCVLVVAAFLAGAMPLWPVAVLGGFVAAAVAAALVARRTRAASRVAHVLDAFRELGRSPRSSAAVVGWVACATLAKVVAVALMASALGVHSPLGAAVIIVPALDVAGLLPLTPGNFGLAGGTVAMALQAKGVSLTTGLSVAIGLHAVESAASIGLGLTGVLFLARFRSPVVRAWTVRLASVAACLALVAAFGATILLQLV
jgi:uncharacterized membrane protein YbhN (UPF0104 family)